MAIFDRLQEVGKAVAGAVVGAVIAVLQTTAADPDGGVANVELPNTTDEWVGFGIAVALGFLVPYLKRNFPSVEKAESDLALAQQRVAKGKQSA